MSHEFEAKQYLPLMPDELFQMWIEPEIESHGWPFHGDEITVTDPSWSKYLRDLGPQFWSQVHWKRVNAAFVEGQIEERAIKVASLLAEVGRRFLETGVAEQTLVKDSPQKVAAIAAAIEANGKLPNPLVFLERSDGWWLMDGHHRLGALFMLGKQRTIPLDCWLGAHAL